ncbi:Cof-type HAD-IIB family hydrolase [Neobacillus niacini]|uniref:Cof-type HAD-IIB family hydrolase n=1 Tax=Neobacillus niacini TaxID=86668 RepID=UPI002FFFAB8B
MKKEIKLLALDLDGTLLTDNNQITEATKRSIQEAIEKGIHVLFATGRGLQTSAQYIEELGLKGPMVFANGAEIWKNPKEVWKRTFIDKNDLIRLCNLSAEKNARFWAYNVESLIRSDAWGSDMFQKEWLKFGISSTNPTILQEMKETIKGWGTLEVTQSHPTNLEITVKGITKESAISEVCGLLSIEMEEVMAIGDSMNDYYLISAVGLGVAMGNAIDEIIRVADTSTDTNEQDGVAKAINRYLLHC